MNEIKKKLKVVFVCGDKSGPHYHDIFIPNQFFHKYDLLTCETQYILDIGQLQTADVIHFQRQYAPESFITIRNMIAQGKVCLFLCDDNIWELPPNNPARGTYEQADVAHRYQEIMRLAHGVCTSTPYLRDKCLGFNPNVRLFRNLVDPAIASFKSPGRDKPGEIRIAWHGTPHHHDDIAIVDEAILTIIQRYPQVKFVFMGYYPPSMEKFTPGRYEYYNFVDVDAFYPCIANLDIDIGLVPLINHPFNWAKTCRKFQEFGILGAATIASNVGNYVDLPSDVVLKVKDNLSPRAWIEAMTYLIENTEERKRRSEASYQYVLDNHDINKYIFERAQVYYDFYAKIRNTERTVVWENEPKERG